MIFTNLGGFDGVRCWSLAMFGLCCSGEHRANMEPEEGRLTRMVSQKGPPEGEGAGAVLRDG